MGNPFIWGLAWYAVIGAMVGAIALAARPLLKDMESDDDGDE